ncbi:uncharacterized protein V6R79_001721 [Siganus canaliculatus]
MEMLNLNCKLIHFIHHLKERCGLDFKDCLELMDIRGRVMNLEGMQQSLALTSSVLTERQRYVVLQVCRDDDTGNRKYVSLLNNSGKTHPEFTELLRKLSKLEKVRGGRTQRSGPAKHGRAKNISAKDRNTT